MKCFSQGVPLTYQHWMPSQMRRTTYMKPYSPEHCLLTRTYSSAFCAIFACSIRALVNPCTTGILLETDPDGNLSGPQHRRITQCNSLTRRADFVQSKSRRVLNYVVHEEDQ